VGNKYINTELDQFGGEVWKAIVLALSPPIFDNEVFSFLISELPKTSLKSFKLAPELRFRCHAEETNPVGPSGLSAHS
jgi:hypothetical protein